jgi:hypothetical protein
MPGAEPQKLSPDKSRSSENGDTHVLHAHHMHGEA